MNFKNKLSTKNISIKQILADKAIYIVLLALLVIVVIIEPKFLSFGNFKIYLHSLQPESSLHLQQVWF